MDEATLAELIEQNPGALFVIDNDWWGMYPPNSDDTGMENAIVTSSDVIGSARGYGSGNTYGGDVLQALAIVAGVKVESV